MRPSHGFGKSPDRERHEWYRLMIVTSMPCWAEMEPGVFERQVVAKEYILAQVGT